MVSATRSLTRPAPARAAPVPARYAAPVKPRLPASTTTVPKVPLWASRGRSGRMTASGAGRRMSAISGISRCEVATANPLWWVMLTSTRAPRWSPRSLTLGAPAGPGRTSMRRRGKQMPVPSKHLITASLAAQPFGVGARVGELGGGVDLVQEAAAGPLDRERDPLDRDGIDADALHDPSMRGTRARLRLIGAPNGRSQPSHFHR